MKLLVFALLAAGSLWAPGALRLLIITYMEGVGGVHNWDEQVTPGQRRFEESGKLLIGEVNAAVAGAFDAGAGEVVIWDGHGGSRTLSISEIDTRAKLIQGSRTPATFYLDSGHYDGLMFVGQHAMAGSGGILAHTQSRNVKVVTINGRPVGELGQAMAIAGYYGIPAIFLSGDQTACDEMRAFQPGAEVVAVKRLVGRASALSISHEEAKRQIREHVRQAVLRINEFKPWKIEGPVEMRFEFLPETAGGSVIKPAPEPRVYKGANVLETFQAWLGR
jgi:D-amino peptidase